MVSIAVYGADKKPINTNIWCSGILQELSPQIHKAITLIEKVGNELRVTMLPNYPKPYCTALGLYLNLLIESPKEKAKK